MLSSNALGSTSSINIGWNCLNPKSYHYILMLCITGAWNSEGFSVLYTVIHSWLYNVLSLCYSTLFIILNDGVSMLYAVSFFILMCSNFVFFTRLTLTQCSVIFRVFCDIHCFRYGTSTLCRVHKHI
jgi:hypothetical protein